ncbi:ATP-binding protein [Brachybacterium fresconis]|uniref:ATP-dependent DNA helicase RecG n=1 Tax=Brachybacterium fresconis TaxID=173363 RepID=A0ABS4YM87_9MICO|nr:ATP-binding protein [Brachybacterium fresconis]MBP2409512.1 ATP-dependent DNA helicase RecG [Brachybacterium fresconis]
MDDQELAEHVARLRRQRQDDAHVEAKAAASGAPKDLWRSVSAFANTEGGLIILGLDEASGFVPAEGFDPQRTLDVVLTGFDASPGTHAKITPIPPHELGRSEVDGAQVVTLRIDALDGTSGAKLPCFVTAQGLEAGSYKRVADANKRLTHYEVYLLHSKRRQDRTDRETVEGRTLAELSTDLVSRTLEGLRTRGRALTGIETGDIQGGLHRVNAVDADGVPTLAGYLALGAYPQQEFPHLAIDVAAHPGTEKSHDPTLRFLDRQECDGPMPQAINDAVRAVLRNLRTRRVVDGTAGTDVPEIPADVLREAITNAVLHRDYSPYVRGQQVAVDIFPDRVEVKSPGGFWGDRTKENVAEGYSTSRNESLVQLLRVVPMPDGQSTVAENQGSGVQLMVAAMRRHGLPAPDYSSTSIDHVVVKLARFGLIDPSMRAWIDGLSERDHRDRQHDVALALAKLNQQVSVADLRINLGLDSDDCREVLAELVADGLLEGMNDGPYVLVDPGMTEAVSGARWEILSILDVTTAKSIAEIAEATGKTRNALRPLLRDLVDQGLVLATAPPQSRNRTYLIPPSR